MSFLDVKSLSDAIALFSEHIQSLPKLQERRSLTDSCGYVLAEDMYALEDLPQFHRSTVDGYAVNSSDTTGASEFSPSFFTLTGRVEMGQAPNCTVTPGTAVYVPTGAMIPDGADAVVMIEYTETFDAQTIAVYHAAAPFSGIMQKGEDLKSGTQLLTSGTCMTPAMIGALASLGYDSVLVQKPPRVAFFSTGDEIITPPTPLAPGQVWNVTRYTAQSLLAQHQIPIQTIAHIPDDLCTLQATLESAIASHDIILLSGGSSVGEKDHVSRAIAALGKPGMLFHGLLMKPGKPTIGARINDCLIIGLPGHPGASFFVLLEFVLPVLSAYLGKKPSTTPQLSCTLSKNLPASDGRRSYYLVSLEQVGDTCFAHPIYAKSGAITNFSKADGYLVIAEGGEGLLQGSTVQITQL